MPKIEINDKLFFKTLGRKYNREQLEKILPYAKAELDDWNEEEHILKIELNDTSRPDLWSLSGLARSLNTIKGKNKEYKYLSRKKSNKDTEDRSFIVKKDAPEYRPYSIGFAACGKKVDDAILKCLIHSQEKLCFNYGRKRKMLAIGIYRSKLINYPVYYTSADPDKVSFTPLHENREMTLREVATLTPKGKEYGHIISDKKVYPCLKDNTGAILSLPPVLNSNDLGAVEIGDSDLFIEMSGENLNMLLLSANILASDMSDLGFTILPIKNKFENGSEYGDEITVPYYFQQSTKTTLKEIEKIIGVHFSADKVVKNLKKMDIKATVDKKGNVKAFPPSYRNDLISSVDIIEDVAIAEGLEKIGKETVKDYTLGRLTESEHFSRVIRGIMTGLGFQEMIYNYLSSFKEYVDNMRVTSSNMIEIMNPMSEKYALVRSSIIPSLLKTESLSLHAPYPHKCYEYGKTAFKDKTSTGGTRTINSFAFMCTGEKEDYNSISNIVYTIFYFLGKTYTLKEVDDPRFIKGRQAEVYIDEKMVGIFGEIHPEVLLNWNIDIPCVCAEFNADMIR